MVHYICEIPKETSAKMEVATVGWCSPRGFEEQLLVCQ